MSRLSPPSPRTEARHALRCSERRMGRGDLLIRPGHPVAPEFYRVRRGSSFEFTLQWPQAPESASCHLHTDLLGETPGGPFHSVPMRRADARTFHVSLPVRHAGVFCFQVHYSEDDKTCFREPRPYSRVMVHPAGVENLRMYTLIPRVSGPMTRWGEHLRHIRDMGFNAVHVLPVTRMCRSRSPYSAIDLFSVEPALADPHDPCSPLGQFEAFVEEARRLDIRLCFDLVINHIGLHSDLVRHRPEWVCADDQEPDGLKRAGYQAGEKWIKWQDLVLLDHDLPDPQQREALWEHLLAYADLWAGYADSTGGMVRLDNAHSTPEPFLARLLSRLRQRHPDLGVLAELFCDLNRAQRLVWEHGLHLILGTPWEIPFVPQLRTYLSFLHAQHPRLMHFAPISSADSGSPAQEFGSAASTLPRYAFSTLLGTGATGMAQGVEFAVAKRVEFIGDPATPPYGGDPVFRDEIARMNRLMDSSPAFSQTGNLTLVDGDHHAVIAALRSVPGESVFYLVAANFDTQSGHELAPSDPRFSGARAEDLTGQPAPAIEGHRLRLTLSPCSYRVLKITPG